MQPTAFLLQGASWAKGWKRGSVIGRSAAATAFKPRSSQDTKILCSEGSLHLLKSDLKSISGTNI